MRRRQRNAGFTLLELMLSMAVATVIMSALMMFSGQFMRVFERQFWQVALMQEGQYAVFLLQRHIRLAGLQACVADAPAVNDMLAISGKSISLHHDEMTLGECQSYQGKEQFMLEKFFVKNHKLYWQRIGSRSEQLIPNVDAFNIRYGVCQKNLDIQYVTADNVSQWKSVCSVSFLLTLRKQSIQQYWRGYALLREKNV